SPTNRQRYSWRANAASWAPPLFASFERPRFVILATAKVGGIHVNNTYPSGFIVNNLCGFLVALP
ncbi:hypothetical protein FCV25MIE_01477, partial [Fagus crenata]